jgi:predicted DNA-binding protein (MmcQ/YjbR family)
MNEAMTRQDLIDFCLSLPAAYEDYPFDDGAAHSDNGAWTVVRHRTNKKGFAHIYERNGNLCINLKYDPFEADFLRQAYESVTPGWHMNKVHWNTVTLGAGPSCASDVPEDELKRMIERSYDLIKPKARVKKYVQ